MTAFCILFMFCILCGKKKTSYTLTTYKQPLITTVCHKNYELRVLMLTLPSSSMSLTLKCFTYVWQIASWIYWLCYGSYQCTPCTFNSCIISNSVYLSPSSSKKYILSYLPQYKPTVITVHLKPFNFFLFPLSLWHSLMPVDCTYYSTEFGISNGPVSISAASWYCKQQCYTLPCISSVLVLALKCYINR